MSLDYPYYEKLRKKSKFLGILWRMGDCGYYFGLFWMVGMPLHSIVGRFTDSSRNEPLHLTLLSAICFATIGFFINYACGNLKYFALKKGGVLDEDGERDC